MANMKSWSGDWYARIRERAKAKGYESVTAFADARPRASLLALAEELGAEDVNGAQLLTVLRDEAEEGRFVERFARCLLVHEIYEAIPKGWRVAPDDGFDFEFNATGPLVTLITELPKSHETMARNLARIMMAAELPVGWLPEGPDDPVLVALFERAKAADVTS